ncbi:MAG: hypothetical protein ABIJ09_06475 [Pseudomonadota bacterium]
MRKRIIELCVLLGITCGLAIHQVACECDPPSLVDIPEPDSQTDIFSQKAAAEVDILWVVDNSESMEAEQNKIADRFSTFFKQLLISQVNFHIGVITTDIDEGGALQQYTGQIVANCDGCRFITKDVPCPNPDVSFNPGTPEAQIEAGLATECPSQLVFRKLIKVGTDGANFEQGLTTAALALGARIDPATGGPQVDSSGNRIIPPENVGFLRSTASLYLIFVSDEQDSSRGPTRYFYRLFEGLKYAGNENRIGISAITGWPVESQGIPMDRVCEILDSSFDSDPGNDDPNLQTVYDIMDMTYGGCFDPSDSSPNRFAAVGARFVELACRTGGVVADICSDSYSDALEDLGANAAGLLRKFELSKPATEVHFGVDCEPFTSDDPSVACGEISEVDHASPLCVIATPLAGGGETVVPMSEVSGWRFEKSTNSIRFDGSFVPAPGTEVRISYKLRPSSLPKCTN